jgi:hypothetical protein
LTEDYGNVIQEVLENTISAAAQTLENDLTGGTSFDSLMESFDRVKSQQSEYLTDTNAAYEK